MALRALMLKKKITEKQRQLDELRATAEALTVRETELETAINEAETDEEKATVEEAVTAYESEKEENDKQTAQAQEELDALNAELNAVEAKQAAPVDPEATPQAAAPEAAAPESRKENVKMDVRKNEKFADMRAKVAPYIEREDVKTFLNTARACMVEKRALTGTGVLIPEVFLGVLRENVIEYSKLYSRVYVRQLAGEGRMAVAGTIPEAVWTEMCAKLNELDLGFNSVEVGGWKIGGYFAVCNATLEDSEVDLAAEIMVALAQSIGIALDKAILYGTGTRMPLGIVARLAQTADPGSADPNARPWVDLHTSNIKTIAAGTTGTALLTEITLASGAAKSSYSRGAKVWCMNETTYTALIANAIAVTAAGAIVSGVNGTMPVVGGDVIVLNFIPDNVIIGGYMDLYLLAERGGARFNTSDQAFFLADQTVFKGTARYDGQPVIPEAFVAIGLNGVTPSAAMTFAPDTANPAPTLSALNIGGLALSPAFDPDTTTYTATATAATNKINATAADAGDTVAITVNGTAIANGGTATWITGSNTVAVTVTDGSDASAVKVYTVTVTKS